jgi:SAM-dependent methyltransferase
MAKQTNRGFEVNPNKVLWEKGDFTRIAQSMRESGEALVKTLGITKGLKVLDLGCGDGTTALPAARLGAEVLGVDIASNLVAGRQAARQRAGPDAIYGGWSAKGERLIPQRYTYVFNFSGSPSEFVAAFRKSNCRFQEGDASNLPDDLQNELEALFNSQNKSPNKDSTSIPATFLRVTIARH